MDRRNLLLNALRAFEAAARHGRMTGAAEELKVSHSAVSRQIRNLEDNLGVDLFEGPKAAPELTKAGRILLPRLTAAFDEIESAIGLVTQRDNTILDISSIGTFAMRWLIPRLIKFETEHPKVKVRLTTSDGPLSLAPQQVAIRVSKTPPQGDENATLLFPELHGITATREAIERHGFPGILRQMPLLHSYTRKDAWTDWKNAFENLDLSPKRHIEYEHYYYLIEAVISGHGAAVLPLPLIADEIRRQALKAPLGFVRSTYHYYCLKSSRSTKNASMFCAWLAREAASFEASQWDMA